MRKIGWLLLLTLLGATGCAQAPATNSGTVESMKAEVEGLLRDIDAGNFDAMFAKADSNCVVMDVDENNNPIRLDGIAGIRTFSTHLADVAKQGGVKFESKIVSNEAWIRGDTGLDVVEYDQTITAGGQTMGPFKFRGTLVARRDGDRWVWTHWHGSFRETPPPMPVAAQTAP